MPKEEDYRLLVEQEWADLHHSRMQEWTALGVVTGAHLGLIQIVKFAKEESMGVIEVVIFASIIGALFSILGALMTCRHRHLMNKKIVWIYEAEKRLGLIKTKGNEKEGIIPVEEKIEERLKKKKVQLELALPRLLSTSGLMLFFYLIILTVDIFILLMHYFA